MSMPEFVIQYGVQRAWDMIRGMDNYKLGFMMKQLKLERQESYRDLIRTESVLIQLGYPTQPARMPSFSIILQSENESPEGQFLDHGGAENTEPPYPPVNNGEDFYSDDDWQSWGQGLPPEEHYHGVTYPGEMKSQPPALLGVDGPGHVQTGYVGHPGTSGSGPLSDPNYEVRDRMGHTQPLYNEDTQALDSSVTGDDVSIGIQVTTGNMEKTLVYYRLLRQVLRTKAMRTWFEVNGLQRMTFSGMDLRPNESLVPSSSVLVFQRTLSASFLFHEIDIQVAQVVNKFILEFEMATQRPDGSLDFVTIAQIEAAEPQAPAGDPTLLPK